MVAGAGGRRLVGEAAAAGGGGAARKALLADPLRAAAAGDLLQPRRRPHQPRPRRSGSALALVTIALASALVWFVASRLLQLGRPQTGAVICAAIVANTTYLGYPLSVALLGRDHLSTAVLFDVLVGGPTLMFGAFGVAAAFGTKPEKGCASGSAPSSPATHRSTRRCRAARTDVLAPQVLVDASQILAMAILPLGFFAVGATLAEGAEQGELPLPPPMTRPGRPRHRQPPRPRPACSCSSPRR